MAGFDEAQARAALTTMQERLAKGPFVTLGIEQSATADDVRAAFLGLTKRYHPAKFARMSIELQRLSNEIFLGIRGAHDTIAKSLPKPSSSPRARGSAPIRHGTPPQGLQIEPSSTGRSTPPRGLTANRAPSPVPGAQPRAKSPSNGGPPPRFADPKSNPPSAAVRPAPSAPRPAPVDPKAVSGPRPVPKAPTPAFGVRVPPVTPAKPLVGKTQPLPVVVPAFDEQAELAAGQEYIRRRQWTQARQTLQALANRVPASRHYRAMLTYTKAKETATERLVAEAIAELERFIQTEPTHAIAKAALADLRRK